MTDGTTEKNDDRPDDPLENVAEVRAEDDRRAAEQRNALPPGLPALVERCNMIYPDQRNPMRIMTVVQFWDGGPDPLDYINMYDNPGDPMLQIPPHWHYVSFGLSDLHGDGRVHTVSNDMNGKSGYGFELTFRLLKDPLENIPPTWPCRLLQTLAKYVYNTGYTFYAGDHVAWYRSLSGRKSRMEQVLMAKDLQFPTTRTPHGFVRFVQVVGVCTEELNAAQRWNGIHLLELFQSYSATGGPWLITDMQRDKSIFEIDPSVGDDIDRRINIRSSLCGISADICSWHENRNSDGTAFELSSLYDSLENKDNTSLRIEEAHAAMRLGLEESDPSNALYYLPHYVYKTTLNNVHIKLNLEAGLLLPSVLNGRLRHGTHFTFKALWTDEKITFVTSAVTGSFVSDKEPIGYYDLWLQVFIPDSFIDTMEASLNFLKAPMTEPLPKTVTWPERKLTITICPD